MDLDSAIARFFAKSPPGTVQALIGPDSCELFISGSIDMQFSKKLQELLFWITENQEAQSQLIVDLSHVNYISSTGVGALAYALINAKKRNLSFYLRNLQPKVRGVFELLGLLNFFDEVEPDG